MVCRLDSKQTEIIMKQATPILDTIQSPNDLKTKSLSELRLLCDEIRNELLRLVSANGGHLGSNMGIVELTVAMLYVFSPENDKIIFDVGHQSYVYKLLTGRRHLMEQLRQVDGACGFQNRTESTYDCFGGGHAGTAISAGLGFAVERDMRQGDEQVVAIVGDGAFGCGTSLEGMNIIAETTQRMLIVINDNKQSISPNVGAWANYLNTIILNPTFHSTRSFLKNALHKIPIVGKLTSTVYHAIRNLLMPPGKIFKTFGLHYFGPVDGHNLNHLIHAFQHLKDRKDKPTILHVITQKGFGYSPAENDPELYHGVSSFNPQCGITTSDISSFSYVFGKHMMELMNHHPDLIAVTAGTCSGNGLTELRNTFNSRYFDVGIAEEHALVFAAGLAAAGKIPIVSLYATFSQRAVDYMFHDICLQNLPVILCLDRAGMVQDGATHHGIHELSFWRSLPNISVLQPADSFELGEMLKLAIQYKGPTIIRYPKDHADNLSHPTLEVQWGKSELLREGPDGVIYGNGREAQTALQVAEILSRHHISVSVVNPRFLYPFDCEMLKKTSQTRHIVTIDNHTKQGGFSDYITEYLQYPDLRIKHFALPREIIHWGNPTTLRHKYGLTAEQIAQKLLDTKFFKS